MKNEDTFFPLFLAILFLGIVLLLNNCYSAEDKSKGAPLSDFVTKDIFLEF